MKWAWILAFACLGWASDLQAQKVSIDFDVSGMPDGYCRIIGMLGGQNYLVDSVKAKDGKTAYRSDKALAGGMYYFVFPDQRSYLQFLVDQDQTFSLTTKASDPVNAMKVEGSEDNLLLYQNLAFEALQKVSMDSVEGAIQASAQNSPNLAFLNAKKTALLDARKAHLENFKVKYPNSFFTVFKIAGQNPEPEYPKKDDGSLDTLKQLLLYRAAYFGPGDLADERLLRTPVIPNKLKTYITKLVPQSTDSIIKNADALIAASKSCPECFKYIVNWIAIQYEKPTIMGGEAILVHLVDNYFTDDISELWFPGKPEELAKIRKKVSQMRPSMLGKTGQDLRCKNLAGEYESLYDLKTPIKVLFMYSYSCSHCKERAPVLADVLAKWKGKVDVYALCLDPEKDLWKAFVTQYGLESFHNVNDPDLESRYYYKYHVDITPECYVLDQNNKIVAKDLHPNQLESIFEKILATEK